MIGVITNPNEQDVIREFFELFKTPWEFYSEDGQYEILLCDGDAQPDRTAKLVLLYAGRKTHFDGEQSIQTGRQRNHSCILSYQGNRIPIYGETITFPENGSALLTDEGSQERAAYLNQTGESVVVRIGYDLFSEVRTLLTVGQPLANAKIPTLDLHVEILRDLITGCGVSLTEIPPVPKGYPFIACLTHDVDHPSIRQHKWDHTVFGFLYRAVFGSLRNFFRGWISFRDLIANWAAALKLPFVQVGVAKDFWREFDEGYLELEKDLSSTFFVIPFKNYSGKSPQGPAPAFRASRYQAHDIADTIHKLMAAGCEVGLHGIDAWLDCSKGREELEEIRRITRASEIGVRMHWLYQDQGSPILVEQAGASYDSTIGYNQTVGYRAGTTQVYKPLGASRLLELPLHVMDTALFYPDHLGLSPAQAKTLLGRMVDNAKHFGGCLTLNWHDRSLLPERLWGECYREIVQELKSHAPWFSTAGQGTSWFRKRRAAQFEANKAETEGIRAKVTVTHANDLPGLRLRIHKARELSAIGANGPKEYVDLVVEECVESCLSAEVGR
jgi:hypothetical protein